jgi:PadR family transcriptional regulator PadR
MEYGKELLKGSTDTLLLSLLKEQPMYGYQIIKEMERRSRGYFRFREGTLYPALHRLETAGLVKGDWRRLPSEKERRYYQLTEKGLGLLEQKVVEWKGFSSAVNLVMRPVVD